MLSRSVFALIFSSLLTSFSWAQPADIRIANVHIPEVPPVSRVAAAYLVIDNASTLADTLVSVESAAAQVVELHDSTVVDGKRQMTPMQSFSLPAQGQLALTRGGKHLMLINLKKPLQKGELVPLALTFKQMGLVQVQARVVALDHESSRHAHGSAHSTHHH